MLWLALVLAAAAIPVGRGQQFHDYAGEQPGCVWTKLAYTPFVPMTDFYLVNHTIPLSCDDKLLPGQRAMCLRCFSKKTKRECLATVSDAWYDHSDKESCMWNSVNALGERVREFNFTLGINNPSMFSSRVDARVCSVTHEYEVAAPRYSLAYFTAMGNGEIDDRGKQDGAYLPGGWQPDASCVVRHPDTKCNFTLRHTWMLQWSVSTRDIWTNDGVIAAQLGTAGNETCLNRRQQRCVAAKPPFRFKLKITEHKCKPGAQPTKASVIRSGGAFPMAVPGRLLYPGENPKTFRQTSFLLAGLVNATWSVKAERPLMVAVAPAAVALAVCPPGAAVCDYWDKVAPHAYRGTLCYNTHCSSTIAKPTTRKDVLLIAYRKFKAVEQVDPAVTPPQVVRATVTGWRGSLQAALLIPPDGGDLGNLDPQLPGLDTA